MLLSDYNVCDTLVNPPGKYGKYMYDTKHCSGNGVHLVHPQSAAGCLFRWSNYYSVGEPDLPGVYYLVAGSLGAGMWVEQHDLSG